MKKWSPRFVQGPHRSMLVDENVYADAAPRANASGVDGGALGRVSWTVRRTARWSPLPWRCSHEPLLLHVAGAAHRGLSSELTLPLSYRLLQSNAMGALRETLAPELETSELAACGRRCGVAAGAVDGADGGREQTSCAV
eukprot:gene5857-4207_t